MKPFGYYLADEAFPPWLNLYYRTLGKPFSWEKPKLILRELGAASDDRILDIGCRRGELVAEIAARSGAKVVGLDINDDLIGQAIPRRSREAGRIALTAGDARRLPFAAESFSKILILDCLEHLEDDAAVLRELHRVLRPGGMLIVTIPTIPGHPPHALFTRIIPHLPDSALLNTRTYGDNKGKTLEYADRQDDAVVLARITHEERIAAFGHYRHYTEEMMRQLVPACGFKIEKMLRFQKLFESEMMYFYFAVKGFKSYALYPLMRLVTLLDIFLPASYPGVGLLVKCYKE